MKSGYGAVLSWDTQNGLTADGDMGFLSKNDPSIPDFTPRPTFFVYHLMPQNTGEKVIMATSSDPNIYVFVSKFQNGEIGITLVNLTSSAVKVKLNISNFIAGTKMYWHELYAPNETDYKVYINGQTTSLPRGGPDNYFAIDPYSRNISGNFLFDAKPYSSNFISLETAFLPLKIIGFTGTNKNNSTVLYWATVNNNDITTFEIQRSSDKENFETIGQVKPSGNDIFQFIDPDLKEGFYYRIKQNNSDESSDFSQIIFVQAENENWKVYADFLENKLYIIGIKETYYLSLVDIQGREVYNTNHSNQVVSLPNNIPSGMYFIRIISGNKLKSYKVIIN